MEIKGFFQFEIIINVLVSSFFCFILRLYLSLYDFYSVKIQPRACSMPLSWTVVEYHSQSHWARLR